MTFCVRVPTGDFRIEINFDQMLYLVFQSNCCGAEVSKICLYLKERIKIKNKKSCPDTRPRVISVLRSKMEHCQIEGLSVRVMAHNHRRLKVMNRPGDGSEVIVLV